MRGREGEGEREEGENGNKRKQNNTLLKEKRRKQHKGMDIKTEQKKITLIERNTKHRDPQRGSSWCLIFQKSFRAQLCTRHKPTVALGVRGTSEAGDRWHLLRSYWRWHYELK